MAINKLVIVDKNGSEVKFDLTADTITADKLASGYTAHDKSGEQIVGTNTNDVDSSSATAAVAEVLLGKTFAARGQMFAGAMPNNGAVEGTISLKDGVYQIPTGFHDGSGSVSISSVEQAKIVASNIRQGVTILGVEGSYSPSSEITSQAKTVTPSLTEQTVLPDEGYTHLSQVTVAPIPISYADNSAGGTTVTIG